MYSILRRRIWTAFRGRLRQSACRSRSAPSVWRSTGGQDLIQYYNIMMMCSARGNNETDLRVVHSYEPHAAAVWTDTKHLYRDNIAARCIHADLRVGGWSSLPAACLIPLKSRSHIYIAPTYILLSLYCTAGYPCTCTSLLLSFLILFWSLFPRRRSRINIVF